MVRFPRSLRGRLLLLVAVSLLPAFVLLVVSAHEERLRERNKIRAEAAGVVERVRTRHEQLLRQTRVIAMLAGRVGAVIRADDTCPAFMRELDRQHAFHSAFVVAGPDGRVLCSSLERPLNVDAADEDWFRRARDEGRVVTVDVGRGSQSGRFTHIVAAPVETARPDARAAVFAAGVDLAWLHAFAADAHLPAGAALAAFDADGTILARYPHPERFVGEKIESWGVHQAALRGPGTGELRGFDGVERLFAWAPLPGSERAFISYGIPADLAFAPIDAALDRNLLLLGLVTVLAFGAAWVISDVVVLRRVRALVAATRRMRSGDLTVRSGIADGDEIGALGAAFDKMAETLERREAERARDEQEIRELNDRLSDRVDELAVVNRELEAFAYSVSHDLRAPLRAIDGFSRILLEDHAEDVGRDGRRYLDLVRASAQQMGRLIDDLLAFSRLGRARMETREVSLERVVQRAWAELAPAREERDVELVLGELPTVQADESLLKQVLVNLLANALKFTRARPRARIEVSCTRAGGMVTCVVRDNGVGFDMRYADKLFGVFQRLHRAEEYEGTGVGLATVQRIVHRHGGRVWAEGEPDAGASFYFTLHSGGTQP